MEKINDTYYQVIISTIRNWFFVEITLNYYEI